VERVAVRRVPDVFGGADVLFERRLQVIDGHPEREQRPANLVRRRHACRGAEDQSRECPGGEAERDPGETTRWQRGAEDNRSQSRERDQETGDEPD
jgi:hypothetical protein